MQARPCLLRPKLVTIMMLSTMTMNSSGQLVSCGMPVMPAAPLVISMFSTTMRMISEKPRVAMAR